jgi:hypothetical protein
MATGSSQLPARKLENHLSQLVPAQLLATALFAVLVGTHTTVASDQVTEPTSLLLDQLYVLHIAKG